MTSVFEKGYWTMTETSHIDELASRFGNRFVIEEVPDNRLPESGMPAADAKRLIVDEMVLDGDPARNLATFVTTRMEPEAREVILGGLHRNFIDHAEYPRTAEIE
jgi:glutamate decarboxylase